MSSPLISVVTAVHNGAALLPETIRCIQAQDYSDWEYIIVDDASTDGTCEVVETFAQSDPRIKLLRRTECGGPYVAANDAIGVSRGAYIFRIDGDDLCPPNRFASQLAFMDRHPEYRASISFWQAFDQSGQLKGPPVSVPKSPQVLKWHLLLRSASVHSTACFEREALKAVGGYCALPLSQDYRMWCELTRRNWLGVIPDVLSYVRFHEGRSTNQRSALQRRLAFDVLKDHWRALTGEICSPDELEALWAVGYSEPYPLASGLNMLDRWERHYQRDPVLTHKDKAELETLRDIRRWKFLRSNLRRQPRAALRNVFTLAVLEPRSLGIARQALFSS